MILSICDEPGLMNIFRIVVLLINIVKVVVPIILIIFVMIKITGAVVKHDQEEITKTVKSCIPNIIAAVLIFLIPTLVDIVVRLSFPNSDYSKCISGITREKIDAVYDENMNDLLTFAEESLKYTDYSVAKQYLQYIKDKDKREQYEERLNALEAQLDEIYKDKEKEITKSTMISTGLGREIEAQPELIEACKWVLNDEDLQIRLQTCPPGPYKYTNPDQELPGGSGEATTGQAVALKTISLFEYQKGVFFGEEKIEIDEDSRYAFMIIYKTVFLHNTVWRVIANNKTFGEFKEIYYNAGSCSQNYRNTLRVSKYDSGLYKAEIDDAVEKTRYLVLANKDGTTTDARYHSFTGIEQQIEAAGSQGKNYVEILEDIINSGNDDAYYYKNARVYDCRNLIENGTFEPKDNISTSDISSNIIYLGDSRVEAYKNIKSELGFDDKTESIFATGGAKYDDRFLANMTDAKNLITSHKDKTYAITVNYGVNAPTTMLGFCDFYVDFVNSIDRKNKFIIVSVNPFDESISVHYELDNRNENIEKFNNYMKTTCINRIKEKTPNAQVYYCDVYGSLPLSEWVSKKYISDDGIHYTTAGYKYIYNYTKKCVTKYGG